MKINFKKLSYNTKEILGTIAFSSILVGGPVVICKALEKENDRILSEKVETAIILDSIAKTNYALGMQAVRDSLANAR